MTAASITMRPADPIADEAVGAVVAQQAMQAVRHGSPVDLAWLRFIELAAGYGWRSTACRAFITEVTKRAAASAEACECPTSSPARGAQ